MTDTIAAIRPYIVPVDSDPPDWWPGKVYVLVRVETSDGLVGWGECHVGTHREAPLAAMVSAVGDWLRGRPADDIHAISHDAFYGFGQERAGFEVFSAFAGVEIALWDILGKRLGKPVHALLGAMHHTSIPVYANTYSPKPQPPDAYAAWARRLVAAGHRMLKLYPFLTGRSTDEGLTQLQAVRDAVGPGIALAVDLWRKHTPDETLALARAMEPFDLVWIEDPFAPTDAAALRSVRDAIAQPLLTGETLAARHEFQPLFDAGAVDMVNPDICLSGPVELHAIAAMADQTGVQVSPHNSNTMTVGTAAAVHAAVGLSNLAPVEFFPVFETALDDLIGGRPMIVDGAIAIPTAPGLGLSVDAAALNRYAV